MDDLIGARESVEAGVYQEPRQSGLFISLVISL